MPIFKMTQTIDCKVEDAFRVATDVKNLPEWNPLVLEVTPLTGEKVDVGAQFVFKLSKIGNQTMEITDFRLNESITYSPISRMFTGFHKWDFAELDGKTRIDHTQKMSLKGFFRILLPISPLLKLMAGSITKTDAASIQEHLEKQSR